MLGHVYKTTEGITGYFPDIGQDAEKVAETQSQLKTQHARTAAIAKTQNNVIGIRGPDDRVAAEQRIDATLRSNDT